MDRKKITIYVTGEDHSGAQLVSNLIAFALKAAGMDTTQDGLPVTQRAGVTRSSQVLRSLGVTTRSEVTIETVEPAPPDMTLSQFKTWAASVVPEPERLAFVAKRGTSPMEPATPFKRWAAGEKLTDTDLIAAVDETITRLAAFKAERKEETADHSRRTPKELINSGWSDEKVQEEMDRRAHPEATADAERWARPEAGPALVKGERFPMGLKKDPRPNWVVKLDAAIAAAEPGGPLIGLLGWSTYRGVRMVAEVVRLMPASIEVKLWDFRKVLGKIVLDPEPGCILGRVLRDNFKPLPFRDQPDKLKPILKEIYIPKPPVKLDWVRTDLAGGWKSGNGLYEIWRQSQPREDAPGYVVAYRGKWLTEFATSPTNAKRYAQEHFTKGSK